MSVSEMLEGMLRGLSAGGVTDIFIYAILGILFLSIFQAMKGKHSQFLMHAPTLMTSLGILGTFVGIVIGLLAFDPTNIDSSIGPLLEGLKTAFTTSLVGMFASISFKFLDAWKFSPMRDDAETKEDVTPKDIYEVLVKNNKLTTELMKGITGDQEGSLIGEFKILRTNVSDFKNNTEQARKEFNDRLWQEMSNFAEMMSKSATEQVIEALKLVIVEFNEKLTEQFGDNFKRLDESVKKLVDWQDQYMRQLAQMTIQYAEGVKAIDQTRSAVETISDRAGDIPKSMDSLRDVMDVNQHQIAELQRHLEAFVQMRDKAVEAVPQIKEQITDVGNKLQEGTEQMRIVMLEGATSFKDSVGQTNVAMTEMANHVNTQSNEIATTLKDTATELNSTGRAMLEDLGQGAKNLQEQLDNTIESVLATLRRDVEATLSGVDQQIESAVGRTGEAVNRQLAALDEALQQELNTAMENLGSALSTIARHLVDTYEDNAGSNR